MSAKHGKKRDIYQKLLQTLKGWQQLAAFLWKRPSVVQRGRQMECVYASKGRCVEMTRDELNA